MIPISPLRARTAQAGASRTLCLHAAGDRSAGMAPRQPLRRSGRRATAVAALALLLAGCAGSGPTLDSVRSAAESALGQGSPATLDTADITAGLKEALALGADSVVAQLGQSGGFASDPQIRIPLPGSLVKARDFASKVGLEQPFDNLEQRLNAAAEAATPKARGLLLGAIRSMSVDDARGILQGPDDAATQYFRSRTGSELAAEMRPIVDRALAEVGAVNTFNDLMQRYRSIPLAPKIDADLTGYVVDESTDGIFYYLAREEAAIRNNPLKRSSELLRRVFGGR